mmetsp:Transcript_47162/g.121876  ORF Transcript_47162/g.121876 Transcript_47162/m.121876 type:complete len:165 (-) Transcript_47162:2040-2534(-)|eukprot:CAMPEP_0113878262 /NCGR_PEP_ID=MMETSP0780_2-20120614/6573_1 /TAXON_ID=652834 /ORGANISM="Palpitomonas bilix" /LENGTH=164 /DNA_ID=CAMNT_0000864689 /DNA_START=217 /DNA_END=711 /DNA_ORIENTATION=+ /assembly_acc=CAM_ASM_000599
MSEVKVTRVNLLNNPGKFTDPIVFNIEFECLTDLADDLEWKIIYVGSASDSKYDQVLDSALVGPVERGSMEFEFGAEAPDIVKIPEADIVGVTVILLTCSYKDQEFLRIGYYVNNDYVDIVCSPENERPDVSKYAGLSLQERSKYISRNILEEPRITNFQIDWN